MLFKAKPGYYTNYIPYRVTNISLNFKAIL